MNVHKNWTTPSFDLPAVAADTGPFTRRGFLRHWWELRARDATLQLVDTGEALLPFCLGDGKITFAGEADLTDYHSPLGKGVAAAVATWAASLPQGTEVNLDSIPASAADPIVAGLRSAGLEPSRSQHTITAIIDLPATFDEWLAGLGRKSRHEVRRKLRRFEAGAGTPSLSREPDGVGLFARMHREASGAKGSFMTSAMEQFFAGLTQHCDAVVDVLRNQRGQPVAAAFGFEMEDTYFLYNSAYAPDAAELSPGIVLVTALVREATRAGKRRLDFLKGDERYKFDLGARPRPLYRVTATAGGPA